MPQFNDDGEVRGAGGVVLRGGEVLVVHRPKYDDWTLPKGKVDPGESDEACAVREVREETGLSCTLGRELLTVHYIDHRGRPKAVRYWEMRADEPAAAFVPNEEIDEVRWLPVPDALRLLSYEHEAEVLDPYLRVLVLVRHAVAFGRGEWEGPDRYRPLSPQGREQSAALVGTLLPFGVSRVLSSPATRCVETVEPVAKAVGVDVEEVEDLYEGHGTDALELVLSCGTWRKAPGSTRQNGVGGGAVVVCSHGDVLPELLRAVAAELSLGDGVPFDPPFAKGAAWVVDAAQAQARYLEPPA